MKINSISRRGLTRGMTAMVACTLAFVASGCGAPKAVPNPDNDAGKSPAPEKKEESRSRGS